MSTSAIHLNLINESNDQNNSEIVIFSKNESEAFNEVAVAWKVIQNLGTGWQHPFSFPLSFQVGASDSWGNEMIHPLQAEYGQAFHVYKDASGDELSYFGPSASQEEVEIRNDLQVGAINANIYKDGSLYATKTGIAPGQKAVFQSKPTIWIGVVSQVEQGQIMNSAILSDINTELNLLGITSADIIMTGGGTGPSAQPFVFTLSNVVVYA